MSSNDLIKSVCAPRIFVRRSEPVLLCQAAGEAYIKGSLLFAPTRLLKISLANREKEFAIDDRVSWEGNEVRILPESGVPFLTEDALYPEIKGERALEWHRDRRRYLHFYEGHYFHQLQIVIDYETDAAWDGVRALVELERLPQYRSLIRDGGNISIALIGDSISKGGNASATENVSPFQPSYEKLIIAGIRQQVKGVVDFENFAVGGMTAAWGRGQIDRVAERRANLVMLAFGMNDASELRSVEEFMDDMNHMIAKVRKNPDTEVLVISGMSPNPAWHLAELQRREEYHQEMGELRTVGVAVADVRSLWDAVVAKKGFWSMTGNGINHPNDFGHRLYAHVIGATLGLPVGLPVGDGIS